MFGDIINTLMVIRQNIFNTFILNKKDEYPALYPSTLIYMYNNTDSSKIKEIYIQNGVDLLENSYKK